MERNQLKVRIGREKPVNLLEVAALQTLNRIQQRIHKMTRIKIADKNKPIMSPSIEAEIESALAMYAKKTVWTDWGMDTLRKQGNMVLLEGPPGTGKTKIAEYMSKRVGKGMLTLNMKDVGGKAPGHTERMVHEKFQEGRTSGMKTIFMDECEAVLWDRGKAGSDSMWMVGVIDELLMQTGKYPGLIVAATNRAEIVDPALKSRCFAVLQIGIPEMPERERLWEQKIPARFPVQLTKIQRERLSEFVIVGRDIETCILREASAAIVHSRNPSYLGLLEQVKKIAK